MVINGVRYKFKSQLNLYLTPVNYLMRRECADSIRARDKSVSQKAGYMGAIFFLSD